MEDGSPDGIIAGVEGLTIPEARIVRCLDLAESSDLIPTPREELSLQRAMIWDGVRSAVARLLAGRDGIRVADIRATGALPEEIPPLAQVLAAAVAAEALPVRSQGAGAGGRFAAHQQLVNRLIPVFTGLLEREAE